MTRKPKENVPDCKFNEGVACATPEECDNCGWNDKVAAERAIRIRAQMGYIIIKE